MSARTQLRDALKAGLPVTYRVIAAPVIPDKVTHPTILLWQSDVSRMQQIGHDRLMVSLPLWVLVGNENTDAAEAALEQALDALIEVLRPLPWVDWPNAERLTYGDPDGPNYHGYRFNLTTIATIGE